MSLSNASESDVLDVVLEGTDPAWRAGATGYLALVTGASVDEANPLANECTYTGSGVLAICLVKPLADISIPVSGMWSERDLVNQINSLPKIADGACLAWMLFSAGATTNNSPFNFALDVGWGG